MRSFLIALMLCFTFFMPVLAHVVFTGNCSTDFYDPVSGHLKPGVKRYYDPGGKDVGMPIPPFTPNDTSGWDLYATDYSYDRSSDIMYIGLNFYGIGGDADGDGDPSRTGAKLASLGGVDHANLTPDGAICASLDTNNDGIYEVVVGSSGFGVESPFGTYHYVERSIVPALDFGTKFDPDPSVLFAIPNATCPDYEYYITHFSKLPGFNFNPGESFDFSKTAFAGSLADDGIGEDFMGSHVYFVFNDSGDAPASYGTLLKDNGPVHEIVHDLHLGNSITDEEDGQPSYHADADKGDDGVSFTGIYAGTDSSITVNASAPGKLNAWMDFNGNGNWSEPDEHIFVDKDLVEGNNTLTFNVPSGAKQGNTFARFRFSTTGGLSSGGLAPDGTIPDGEVEDYEVNIETPATLGDRAWKDGNRNGIQDPGEGGLPGVTVDLFKSDNSPVGTNVTNAEGNYLFRDLVPGDYYLVFHAPQYYTFSPMDRGSDDAVDSDADVVSGKTNIIHLIAGQEDLNWDAGIQYPSEINVTKVAYPTTASSGAEIGFDIQIVNRGDTALSQVTAKDTLPPGMTYVSDNRSGSVSGSIIDWNSLGNLAPCASIPIHLVGRIESGVSGTLTNVVNVTAKDPGDEELTDSAFARVRSLLPKIKVEKTLEPVQYEQYCESKTISGNGIVDSRTSIVDKKIALDYHDAIAGEGELELESDQAMSEAAGKLQRDVPSMDGKNKSSLNFFEQTKLGFNGSKPLTGGKSIQSTAFYGGSGAEVQEKFNAEKMEKSQTVFFGSTDNATSPYTVGMDLSSSFKGSMETDSKMHKMFSEDIKSRQLFSGKFNLEKIVKFHENATEAQPKIGCGIDC